LPTNPEGKGKGKKIKNKEKWLNNKSGVSVHEKKDLTPFQKAKG